MLNKRSREAILNQLVEKAIGILPMMPSSNGNPANAYDILDLQFSRLEQQVKVATNEELKTQLAEMICWMAIIIEERSLFSEPISRNGMSRAGHRPKVLNPH